MNKPYIFDAITNTLTATATFLRKASIFNSVEYNIVKGIRADYPSVTIVKAETKKSKTHRLTLGQMVQHIELMDKMNGTNVKAKYDLVKQMSKIQANPYKYVFIWFESAFPNWKTQVLFDGNGNLCYPAELAAAIQPKPQDKPGTVTIPNPELTVVPQTGKETDKGEEVAAA